MKTSTNKNHKKKLVCPFGILQVLNPQTLSKKKTWAQTQTRHSCHPESYLNHTRKVIACLHAMVWAKFSCNNQWHTKITYNIYKSIRRKANWLMYLSISIGDPICHLKCPNSFSKSGKEACKKNWIEHVIPQHNSIIIKCRPETSISALEYIWHATPFHPCYVGLCF